MHRLKSILHQDRLFSVHEDETVYEVARKMADLGVGAILVLDGESLRGVFSERDLMVRVTVAGLDPRNTRLGDVMSTSLATIDESSTVTEAMELMHRHKCRHLPVTQADHVTGMVSMRDLMDFELAQQTDEIRHMRAYITGQS